MTSKISKKIIRIIDDDDEYIYVNNINNINNINNMDNMNINRKINIKLFNTNNINNMILEYFPTSVILHDYTNFHKVLKIKVKDLLSAPVINWSFNRPPDLNRSAEIGRYHYKTKKIIDTMIFLNFDNTKGVFEVIDGIHRIRALQIIKENNSKQIDIINNNNDESEYVFGNNNDASWLYDSYIFINLRINSTMGELVDLFRNLNKSNPVPELYIRDPCLEKKTVIESLVNSWQLKYPSHFSYKNKPNRPNVNRDRFIELLDKIYTKYNISEENKDFLEKIIENLNRDFCLNYPKKLPEKIINKCLETGCWLFIYSIEEILLKMKLSC